MELSSLFTLSYGLYVVSTTHDGVLNGCVINTALQVTAEPVKITVTIAKANLTCDMMLKSKSFALSVLDKNTPMDMISKFGFFSGRDSSKFVEGSYKTDINNNPYLTQNTVAYVSCIVIDTLDLGTHIMFVGEISDCKTLSKEEPLTYSYYHQVKKGTTPKNASSYQAPVKQESKGFKCKICNFVLQADELPADYICPICKKSAEFFEKL